MFEWDIIANEVKGNIVRHKFIPVTCHIGPVHEDAFYNDNIAEGVRPEGPCNSFIVAAVHSQIWPLSYQLSHIFLRNANERLNKG